MDIKLLKKAIREYKKLINKRDTKIGSVVKHYRKLRNLTLEDTAKDVCSVSYLCKVENNQIIPSDKILPGLIKKLYINEDYIYEKENVNWVNHVLDDFEAIKDLYNDNTNKIDYQSKLIKYSYNILTKFNATDAYHLYLELSHYISHFATNEMLFFLFIVTKHLYLMERYYDCINICNEVAEFGFKDKIYMLTQAIQLKSFYKVNRIIDIKQRYDNVLKLLITYGNAIEVKKLINYNLATDATYMSANRLNDEIKKTFENDLNIEYIWFAYYYSKQLTLALDIIKKIAYKKPYYYIMYLITLDKLSKEKELINEVINPYFNVTKSSYHFVMMYLKAKYLKKSHIDFIKYELLNAKFITDEAIIIDYLLYEAEKKFKEEHFYKDTVKVLEIKIKNLKEKSSLIDM